MYLLELVQSRAMIMMKGLKYLSIGDRLKELELFSLEKMRLQEDLTESSLFLKEGPQERWGGNLSGCEVTGQRGVALN